jgi:hypothetical protein
MAYVKTAEQKELNSNVMYRKRKWVQKWPHASVSS